MSNSEAEGGFGSEDFDSTYGIVVANAQRFDRDGSLRRISDEELEFRKRREEISIADFVYVTYRS